MNKTRLGIDMDEVMADLMPEWIRRINKITGKDYTVNDVTNWNVPKSLNLDEELCLKILEDKDLYNNLDPIDGAIKTIKELNEKYDLYIVSYAPTNISLKHKGVWLNKYLPFIERRQWIFTQSKHLIDLDILIDDGIHNLETFKGRAILFTRPWNVECNKFERVNNWKEVRDLLL